MAQNGSIDFILIPDQYKLVLDWSQDSSDPVTNQSTVSWSISFVRMGTAYAGYISSFLNHLEVLANGGKPMIFRTSAKSTIRQLEYRLT